MIKNKKKNTIKNSAKNHKKTDKKISDNYLIIFLFLCKIIVRNKFNK